MEVQIGVGLDNLIFGMSENDVMAILGKPDEIDMYLSFAITYCYNTMMIKLRFDKVEELKLYDIEIFNPHVIMFKQKLIGKSKSQIKSILKKLGYTKIEHEDYACYDMDGFETLFSDEIGTFFAFEFNKLIHIDIEPIINDKDKIIWPLLDSELTERYLQK